MVDGQTLVHPVAESCFFSGPSLKVFSASILMPERNLHLSNNMFSLKYNNSFRFCFYFYFPPLKFGVDDIPIFDGS